MHNMAVIVLKALCFDWSALSLLPLPSPGPGRIRTQRTERLQKDVIIMERLKRQSDMMYT